jgi:hypothetical protein
MEVRSATQRPVIRVARFLICIDVPNTLLPF